MVKNLLRVSNAVSLLVFQSWPWGSQISDKKAEKEYFDCSAVKSIDFVHLRDFPYHYGYLVKVVLFIEHIKCSICPIKSTTLTV